MPGTGAPTSTSQPADGASRLQLTPELVQKIAGRVYRLMLADLRIELERRRGSLLLRIPKNGGRYGL